MSAKKNERGAGRKKVYAVEMVPVTLNVPENRKEEFRDIWRNWLKSIPGVFVEKGKVSKKAAGGKPSSFLVDESGVFQTDEMREAQKLWPKKKSDAKASNSSKASVAPEVDKIDSMLDAAFGQIKNPLDLPNDELDTSGKFEELKPKEPNITSNGKCYKVSVFTGGRFINQYRYLLTEAIALRHEMVSEIANNLKSK